MATTEVKFASVILKPCSTESGDVEEGKVMAERLKSADYIGKAADVAKLHQEKLVSCITKFPTTQVIIVAADEESVVGHACLAFHPKYRDEDGPPFYTEIHIDQDTPTAYTSPLLDAVVGFGYAILTPVAN